jgi:hypothetical protein
MLIGDMTVENEVLQDEDYLYTGYIYYRVLRKRCSGMSGYK